MADSNVISTPNVRPAIAREGRSIGAVLIDSGRLKIQDAERVLHFQREQNLRFGEAAIRLGLLTQADIDYALSRQFDYAYLLPGESAVSEEVVAAYAPFAPKMEALRALRSQLMLRWFGAAAGNNTLAIIGAERSEGRSFIAANLAVMFAQLGERTLLIDADLRHPRQHQLFGLANRTGLSAVLSARAGTEVIQSIPALSNLSVLPAGAEAPNPLELLQRPLFAQLLQQLALKFGVILIDSSSAVETADAQVVAARAGAALVVARRNSARTWRVQGVSARVCESKVAIVGAVLNDH